MACSPRSVTSRMAATRPGARKTAARRAGLAHVDGIEGWEDRGLWREPAARCTDSGPRSALTRLSSEGVAEARMTGDPFQPTAHHRHVAGVIARPFFLLVGAVVFLVDDDQPEVGKGQEQGPNEPRRQRAPRREPPPARFGRASSG